MRVHRTGRNSLAQPLSWTVLDTGPEWQWRGDTEVVGKGSFYLFLAAQHVGCGILAP